MAPGGRAGNRSITEESYCSRQRDSGDGSKGFCNHCGSRLEYSCTRRVPEKTPSFARFACRQTAMALPVPLAELIHEQSNPLQQRPTPQPERTQENAVARVMSPTSSLEWGRVRAQCNVCQCLVLDPTLCANCGVYGHPSCLGIETFLDHHFCARCIPGAIAEYGKFQDAQRREAWRRTLTAQVQNWKHRAIEAIGVSSTIGVAVGGAIATAAGAAAGLAQGAVAGAAASRSASSPPALAAPLADAPAVAEPAPASSTSPTGPPASTTTAVRPRYPKCIACWKPQLGLFRPLVHTYAGDCLQAPASPPEPEVQAPPAAAMPPPIQLDVQSQFDSAASGGDGVGGPVQPVEELPRQGPTAPDLTGGGETAEGLSVARSLRSGTAVLEEVEGGAGQSGGQPFDRSSLPEAIRQTSIDPGPRPRPTPLGPVPPTDIRVQELEGQMLELQLEVQIMRDEMASLAKAAGMASEEAQRAALRADGLE